MSLDAWPTSCRLLSDPLTKREADEHDAARERLRASLAHTRAAAEPIAAQIEQSLPEFTVHDVTHVDALCALLDPEHAKNPPANNGALATNRRVQHPSKGKP